MNRIAATIAVAAGTVVVSALSYKLGATVGRARATVLIIRAAESIRDEMLADKKSAN